MDVENCVLEYADGGDGIDALPEEMARIEIATDVGSCDGAQLQQGLRVVDYKSRMHFNGDLYPVFGGELRVCDPIRRNHFTPLPVENLEVIGRPGAGDPVGSGGVERIAGAPREVHNHGNAKLLGEQDGLAAHVAVPLRPSFIGMQCVAVRTQGTDAGTVVRQNLLKFGKRGSIFEHRELAVRIAGIVAGAKLDRVDTERLEFLENRSQWKLRQQRGKDSNTHNDWYLLKSNRNAKL